MIGSVFLVRMTWLHKLVWHTNDRRRVTLDLPHYVEVHITGLMLRTGLCCGWFG